MLSITPISAFSDNYIWCISDSITRNALIVDPGSAKEVEQYLSENNLNLCAILVTHHHADHIGGIPTLKQNHSVVVYGYKHAKISCIDHELLEGDQITLLGHQFEIIEVPGHTLDHIAYFSNSEPNKPWLFCGDTLFSGGCGRLFEGSPEQMYHSLNKLKSLPKNTEIYCAHEYTLTNLTFAKSLMPTNTDLKQYTKSCQDLRMNNQPTIPTTLDTELKINPFLRADDRELIESLQATGALEDLNEAFVFKATREAKDKF